MCKRMKSNKLVRDKIPEIIKKKGKIPITHIASDSEYWEKLKQKFREEVEEYLADENEEELADVLEVINAIYDFKKIKKRNLEAIRKKKAKERGGFKKRIILENI